MTEKTRTYFCHLYSSNVQINIDYMVSFVVKRKRWVKAVIRLADCKHGERIFKH